MEEVAKLPDCGLKIAVLFDSVTITIVARSEYEASVLYDDIIERLQSGQKISIEASHFKQDKA